MEEFKSNKPLKRVRELQFLSHDHHHGLLLGWKIRTGFKKGIAIERIKAYCNWFYESYLNEHFEIEEDYVFSVLGIKHKRVQKALEDHKILRELFETDDVNESNLRDIEKLLVEHIRFEERILFQEVQLLATSEQLNLIKKADSLQLFEENLNDMFWV